jgi:hypothetical protein
LNWAIHYVCDSPTPTLPHVFCHDLTTIREYQIRKIETEAASGSLSIGSGFSSDHIANRSAFASLKLEGKFGED